MTARFYVQIRFRGERSWRNQDSSTRLFGATAIAADLAAVMSPAQRHVFPNVRIRYRGFVLERWKDGYRQ